MPSLLEKLQYGLTAAVLGFGTFAFAGNIPPANFGTRVLILLAFGILTLRLCQNPFVFLGQIRLFFVPLFIYILFLMLTGFQSLHLLNLSGSPAIGSLNRYATRENWAQLIFYFFYYLTCISSFSNRRSAQSIVSFIGLLVFFVALIGAAQRISGASKVLGILERPSQGSFFGPFINENHFGGYLGLALPLFLAMTHYRLYDLGRATGSKLKGLSRGLQWSMELFDSGAVSFFSLTAFTIAVCFFAQARSSALTILFCLTTYFGVVAFRSGKRRSLFPLLFLVGLASGMAFLIGKDHEIFRIFSVKELVSGWQERWQVAKQSFQVFLDFPFFGTGLGTFRNISSKYVTAGIDQYQWYQSHNDYVQLLAETGAAGFILWFLAIGVLLGIAIQKMRHSDSRWMRLMALQGVLSVMNIAMMEFVDFHLQIPAVALLFTTQLGLLTAVSVFQSTEYESKKVVRRLRVPHRTALYGAGLILLSLGGWLFHCAFTQYRAYQHLQSREDRIYHGEEAVGLEEDNPDAWFRLGWDYLKVRRWLEPSDPERKQLEAQSKTALRRAVMLAPTTAYYWFHLGNAEYELGYPEDAIQAFKKAVEWAPQKSKFLFTLIRALLMESERTQNESERLRYLDLARDLFLESRAFEVPANDSQIQTWLGPEYFERFQSFRRQWG